MGKLMALFTTEYYMYGYKVVEGTKDMDCIRQWYSNDNKLLIALQKAYIHREY